MTVAQIKRFLLLGVLVACAMPSAQADEAFCVADFAGLQSALAAWASAPDGAAVTIRLVRGSYDFNSAAGDTLGIVQATHAASLRFLGGYAAGCVESERVLDPRNTVIDGHGENSSRFELIGIDADALLEGITFTRLDDGVEMHHDPNLPSLGHALAIEQSRIIGNIHQSGGGAYSVRLLGIGSGNSGADLAIRSCLIAYNDNGGFVIGFGELSTGSGGSIALTNSTIADNIARAGFVLQGFNGMTDIGFDVTNDIAWHNGTNASYQDLDVSNAPEPPSVTYSLAGVIVGTIEPTTTNMANDPRFLAQGDGDYHLNVGSPALDSGAPSQLGGFPSQDLDGRARVLGVAIDRGAYEAVPGDLIFFASFSAAQ